jgi:hypothetical protein
VFLDCLPVAGSFIARAFRRSTKELLLKQRELEQYRQTHAHFTDRYLRTCKAQERNVLTKPNPLLDTEEAVKLHLAELGLKLRRAR